MMNFLDSLREYWEKLSERERRLLGITVGVFFAMLIFVAVWTTSSALANVELERDEIRSVLNDIDRAGELLAKRTAERNAIEARYRNKHPPLAAYAENKAREQSLEVRQVLEEPQKDVNGYRRQGARVSFQGVSLRPVIRLIASIEEERMPIAVDRLSILHYSAGDQFKVELGIVGLEQPKKPIVVGGGVTGEGTESEVESP